MANKEGQGVIFKNNQKQNENSPDYSGSINIDGKEIKFSGWIKTSKLGVKYISLSVNRKPAQAKAVSQPVEIEDDALPWD